MIAEESTSLYGISPVSISQRTTPNDLEKRVNKKLLDVMWPNTYHILSVCTILPSHSFLLSLTESFILSSHLLSHLLTLTHIQGKKRQKCTPYIHFLRNWFISYNLWGHPSHSAGEGHFCALIPQLLRRAKVWDLHQVVMGNQHTNREETRRGQNVRKSCTEYVLDCCCLVKCRYWAHLQSFSWIIEHNPICLESINLCFYTSLHVTAFITIWHT